MCVGSHLANRELYTAFLRIIASFEISECRDERERPILDALGCNDIPTGLTTEPKPFKIGLRPRDRRQLREWMEASDERTRDL